MTMSAEHRLKFAALYRQWWRLHMSEQFSSEMINPKTSKQKFHDDMLLYIIKLDSVWPRVLSVRIKKERITTNLRKMVGM